MLPLEIALVRNARPHQLIHYRTSISSTMVEAQALASTGAPPNTVVVADEQTAGIGRLGRTWLSEKNAGLYCSILLRPAVQGSELPIVTLALGLAVVEAIGRTTMIACDLRWPNDVLFAGQKVAGVLAQVAGRDVIAGIGVNVNQRVMPDDLRTAATSLFLATGGETQSRERLLIYLLEAVEHWMGVLQTNGREAILQSFSSASSYACNRLVTYETSTGEEHGVTAGLDANGFLLVRKPDGRLITLHTGGVRPYGTRMSDAAGA